MKKHILALLAFSLIAGPGLMAVLADSLFIDFELRTYGPADIDGQDGWRKSGSYDVFVVTNLFGFSSFAGQSLRLSDAVTNSTLADQTFAKPLVNAVGEADSTDGTFTRGTLQGRFQMQFDLASALQTLQTGMHVSVSPDRGDGSPMSYLRFEDQEDGIHIFFEDVQGTFAVGTVGCPLNPPVYPAGGKCAKFVETDIATVSRTPHTIKLVFDAKDGPSNDVVSVYVDGVLKITGTSWEDYYRFDSASAAEQSPRIVKTVLFSETGTAHPLNLNNGFLVDNLGMSSGPALIGPPTDKDECKNGGWKTFNNPSFKNQGACVSFTNQN